jgi:hypothetical protein
MPKYGKRSFAIEYQRGAAVSAAQGDDVGDLRVTSITNLGLPAGANPTNEWFVFVVS